MERLAGKAGLFNDKQDIRFADVACPEWGLVVRVRGLTATERDAYEASLVAFDRDGKPQRVKQGSRGRLAVLGIVDDAGRRIFTDDDAAQVGDKNAAAVDRLCDKIRELSGMGAEAVEEAKGN